MKKLLLCLLVLTHAQVKSFDWIGLGLYATACALVGKLGHEEYVKMQEVRQQRAAEQLKIEQNVTNEQSALPVQAVAASDDLIVVEDVQSSVVYAPQLDPYSDNFYLGVTAVCLLASMYGSYKLYQCAKHWYQEKNTQETSV